MRKLLAVAGFAAVVGMAGMAMAAADLGAQREKDMKAIGGAVKVSAAFAQGKTEFDPATAKAAMETIAASATNFKTLFPAGSESADTKASPEIWKNKADFEAHADKLIAAATAAAAASGSLESFKTAFGAVGATCKGCHQTYRLSD